MGATKRTQILVSVAAVIIVIIAAGVGAIWVFQKNKGADNSDYTTFWTPKVGKFVEYTMVNDSLFNYNWKMKCTVLSVNATSVMREESWYQATGDLFISNNWSAPINLTFANGFDINYNMGWPVNVTEIGIENITTSWGVRTCICYSALWSVGYTDYFWVHNGVMLKFVGDPLEIGYQAGTGLLTSTNIREVTH